MLGNFSVGLVVRGGRCASQFTGRGTPATSEPRKTLLLKNLSESMEMLPPAPSVGDVPEDDETAPYDHSGDPFLDGDETVDYDEPGRRRAIGAPRVQGTRPRTEGVAKAPPRRVGRRHAVAAPTATRGQLR